MFHTWDYEGDYKQKFGYEAKHSREDVKYPFFATTQMVRRSWRLDPHARYYAICSYNEPSKSHPADTNPYGSYLGYRRKGGYHSTKDMEYEMIAMNNRRDFELPKILTKTPPQ